MKDTRPNAAGHKPAEALETLGPGQTIGRYVLVRCLGVGGAGVVWEGHDGSHAFALKVLRHSASHNVRRHRREARIAMTLQHPNIVPVHEVFDDRALGPVLVMPLLGGETFEKVLGRAGKLSLEHTVAYLLPVLNAIAYAHAQGVVHRDLKPQNVFVQRDRISILDFGVAKLLEESSLAGSAITRTGELLGTPRYMAPEQIFGEQRIDARVDVWAVGVIAYRALSGDLPIAARTLGEVIKVHTRGAIVPLEQRAPELPRDVTNAVMHALQGEHAKRAPSVDGLGNVLSGYARYR
ncbi:serine/threonine-protein kinase [Labilithrix luteola]|uniref:serine/threonine-protein kinase n=1 Tax=Labilithrix luteola TaxID=1391654 RepID=UPI001472D3FB|nr:serine/threonine-protein kinase [Labilithrix luteola]